MWSGAYPTDWPPGGKTDQSQHAPRGLELHAHFPPSWVQSLSTSELSCVILSCSDGVISNAFHHITKNNGNARWVHPQICVLNMAAGILGFSCTGANGREAFESSH